MSWQRAYSAVQAKKLEHSENNKQPNTARGKVISNQMVAASIYTGKGFTDVKAILNLTGNSIKGKFL